MHGLGTHSYSTFVEFICMQFLRFPTYRDPRPYLISVFGKLDL